MTDQTEIPYPWLDTVVAQLSQSWQSQRLHHALLLQGPQGMGKQALVDLVSKGLLCQSRQDLSHCGQCKSCLLMAVGNHPDCRAINRHEQSIGVDDIRQSTQFIYQTAQIAQRQVLQIHHSENLTEAAANALLKTLEEPTANVYIVLTTDDPIRLLATIRSRCFKLAVTANNLPQVYQWLLSQLTDSQNPAQRNLSKEQFKHLFQLAHGAPLRVKQWLEQDKLDQVEQFCRQFDLWRQGQLSGVAFKDVLLDNPFTLLLLHQQVLSVATDWLKQGYLSSSIDQVFAALSDYERHVQQNLGQNKALLLIKLLNQLDAPLQLSA